MDTQKVWDEKDEEISKVRSELAQAEKDTEKLKHQWERDQSRLQEEHLQVTSRLEAALTRSQEEKLKLQESLRTATQAVDEEKKEIYKDVKDAEQLQSQWKLDQSRILEEHLQVTSSFSAGVTKYQEKLEADRSLWNQEKLELFESPRAAPQAVDKDKEAGKKPKKKSLFKRIRKFLCRSGKAVSSAAKTVEGPSPRWRDHQVGEKVPSIYLNVAGGLNRCESPLRCEPVKIGVSLPSDLNRCESPLRPESVKIGVSLPSDLNRCESPLRPESVQISVSLPSGLNRCESPLRSESVRPGVSLPSGLNLCESPLRSESV
ncbi:unnamed protein product [Pleuronectes platessa]|uniref:Uncharacterized protein n=1 Tax=Pleuronectes platessa TaxID=8262 RepID=A0A9N7V8A7_PLEPL|nr:unnamed protein product [Pleuronectes platessa]